MIDFRIDRRSGIPTYVQLVLQVKQALRLGDLQVGDRLPTAKDVVGALAINPNTVLKAYKEPSATDLLLRGPDWARSS
ncbi:GntR family transcriptional regulator [Rhodococcus qingshengii]|uniref:GntR family transcriptional regulator n=1 Tax=Rhodococcus qingshengii TaxID=334542 RepID=UPI00211E0FD6|nr:GntR family transcriptional regulator [Rhodococcus qingshengii]